MKMGFRTPSPKRSFSARTTGKINRTIKKATNPLYGKKGMGYINNPKKAVYNKVYNKTTVGINQVFNGSSSVSQHTFDSKNAVIRVNQLKETAGIINSTTNVAIFFSRFDFALQICDELKAYEYTGCLKNISPEQQKYELVKQLPAVINSLIVRCYDKEFAKAQELKTDKGRHNRIVRFFNNLISDLNQYGSQYITSTNISKIHELATVAGVNNEINVNLTPVILSLPEVKNTVTTHNSSIKSDNKKFCPKCKGTFINHTLCPDCGCSLIDASKEAYEYAENYTSNNSGCLIAFIASICAIPFPIAGFLFWSIDWHGISILTFTIYFLVIYICYKIGENN